ncbi:class II aldolase/adducin family protein [Cohaesibacter gelatinilyticus]|uniref:L-fuculose-phosphate aldolase n=1 Tax=Cohaesibacter gelatinilyticus TaxID=372072 RepID=A0A285PGQ0_9HYPH|nr:class II aldolase/adducin family protein [Cohaesibacter gelatinilyticus]SNZ20902.1 L-fuculose-phosphate aldolase [Cohaesibacter gelatinilyticus]HAT84929.1 class II aldolase [Hyphomicrobiales bacterium]
MSKNECWKLGEEVIKTCLAMNDSGLNHGKSGNVSVRYQDGFLITPSGVAYDQLAPDDLVFMDLEGRYRGDYLPSSEWRFHLAIYQARLDAQAVVHVHSSYAAALACLRQSIPAFHYMVAVAGGKNIRCAEYALFGTDVLSETMMIALEDRKACLLANHGQVAYGDSLANAYWLAGEVEGLARDYCRAKAVGEPHILSDEQMDDVLTKFRFYGKQIEDVPLEEHVFMDLPLKLIS